MMETEIEIEQASWKSVFSVYGRLDNNKYKRDILLGLYIPMLLALSLGVTSSTIAYFVKNTLSGANYFIVLTLTLLFIVVGYLILRKKILVSGLSLIALVAAAGLYTVFEWGIANSVGLLLIALSVFLTVLLFNSKASKWINATILLLFITLSFLQYAGLLRVNYNWEPVPTFYDVIILVSILIVIFVTSSIYSTGLHDQMERIKTLTKELQDTNNALNRNVLLKTKDLISNKSELRDTYSSLAEAYSLMGNIEQDRFTVMNKLAHYGVILTSLVHEMANPVMILMDFIDRSSLRDKEGARIAIHEIAEKIRSVRMGIKTSTVREKIIVEKAIIDSTKMLSWKAKKGRVKVRVKLESSHWIKGDRGRFRQILINLLDNAIDAAAEANKKEVNIVLKKKGKIYISDSGCGISPGSLKKVFTIFYSTKDAGSGIGLFVSRKYAREFFAGEVQIQDTSRSGTTILFTYKID